MTTCRPHRRRRGAAAEARGRNGNRIALGQGIVGYTFERKPSPGADLFRSKLRRKPAAELTDAEVDLILGDEAAR